VGWLVVMVGAEEVVLGDGREGVGGDGVGGGVGRWGEGWAVSVKREWGGGKKRNLVGDEV